MLRLFIFLIIWCHGSVLFSQANPCVSIVNGKFYDPSTSQTFISKGVNFSLDMYSFDGGSTFEFKPNHGYYTGNTATCNGQPNCNIDINNYMQFLKTNLGVNTLRIPMVEGFPTLDNCQGTTFSVNYLTNTPPSYFGSVVLPNNGLSQFAAYYHNILDIAQNNGLKVILLLTGKGSECMDPILKLQYDDYIKATAQACNNHPALLAYDLWNEPQFQHTQGRKKSEICTLSNERYNILKLYDPNHLVTIGMWVADAIEYSTDVYKADFFAFHIYPDFRTISHTDIINDGVNPPYEQVVLDQNLDYNDLQLYIDGFNTKLKWVKNTCNKPFMIGETGFRSRLSNPSDVRMDGDLSAQVNYLQQTFQSTINSGGIGYLWWQAYDVSWGIPNDPGQDDFGLFDPDYTSGTIIPKPSATAFKNFDPTQITGSAVVYPTSPNHYTNLFAYTGTPFNGTVTNDLGEPVPDAYIEGWKLEPSIKHPTYPDYNFPSQTYSLPNGQFVLYSRTPAPGDLLITTQLNTFRVGAVFHNYLYCGSYNNGNPAMFCDGNNYLLTKQQLTDVDLQNQIFFDGYTNTYSASNNLTFNNSFVDFAVPLGSGATGVPSIFTAGREIAITGDSHVSGPYETQFYIDFNPDCSDNTYNQRHANSGTQNKNSKTNTQNNVSSSEVENNIKTIFLNYDNDITNTQATVYPNPLTTGLLNIECDLGISNIVIYNSMGQQVFSQDFGNTIQKNTVNLSKLMGGLYTLHISLPNGNKSIHQLIIQ